MSAKTLIHSLPLLAFACLALHSEFPFAQEAASGDADATAVAPSAEDELATSRTAREQRAMSLLADTLNPDQLLWLSAADREFMAVQRRAWRDPAKGTVLLLHGTGQHPLWPGPLKSLQDYLPLKGWQTLAIALPTPLEQSLPARATTTDAEPGNSSDGEAVEPELGANEQNEIFDDARNSISDGTHKPQLATLKKGNTKQIPTNLPAAVAQEAAATDRIIAAVNHLNAEQKQRIVIIGIDSGAVRLAEFAKDLVASDNAIAGIVFIDARNEVPMIDFRVQEILDGSHRAILDLLTNSEPRLVQDAKQRQAQAQRSQIPYYRQQTLPTNSSDAVNRTVYGFLETLAH